MIVALAACGDKKCDHTYDNACDTVCNVCSEPREIKHDYSQYETNIAKHVKKCSVCGVLDEATREEHVYNDEYACACGYELLQRTVYPNWNGSRYVYLYSQTKKLMFTLRYSSDGKLEWVTENYYDEAGNNVRYLDITYVDEKLEGYTEGKITYDEQGRRVREESYSCDADSNYTKHGWRIYTYAEDGLTGKIEFFDAEGNKTSEDLCLYDTNGNLTTRIYLENNGALSYIICHVYDANGQERQIISGSAKRPSRI